MSNLIYLNESNLTFAAKNFENFFVFEMFDSLFTEPLFCLRSSPSATQPTSASSLVSLQHIQFEKNSYTLSLLKRLHHFQRVIHDTRAKIAQLKQTSLSKFEASSRLRQLQWTRETRAQEVALLRKTLLDMHAQTSRLVDEAKRIDERNRARQEAISQLAETIRQEKQK